MMSSSLQILFLSDSQLLNFTFFVSEFFSSLCLSLFDSYITVKMFSLFFKAFFLFLPVCFFLFLMKLYIVDLLHYLCFHLSLLSLSVSYFYLSLFLILSVFVSAFSLSDCYSDIFSFFLSIFYSLYLSLTFFLFPLIWRSWRSSFYSDWLNLSFPRFHRKYFKSDFNNFDLLFNIFLHTF